VGWWPGDGSADDFQGNNTGTLENGANFASAMVGQSFHLDGVDDFVQVPDNPNQSPSSITIEMWVLAEAIDGLRPIITKYNPLPIGSSWFVEVSDGQIRWGVFPNPTSSWRSVHTASAVISPGEWHHVAVTFDSSSAAMQVYVDSVEVPSVLDSGAPVAAIADSEGPLRIGAEVNAAGTLGGVWKGLIDEAAIFDRALSASEIQAIFNSGSAGKCKVNGLAACSSAPSGLVSWWRGEGTADDSQGSNHGTLYGGASFAVGKVEQAFTFDGLDDFVEIVENTLDLNDDFTIETWVRPEQLTNDFGTPVPIVSKYDFSNQGWGNASYEVSLRGDGSVQFGVTCGQTDMFLVTDNSVVSVDTFAHIAAVYRRTPVTSLEIYVNGVSQPGTTHGSCSSINQNDVPFRIGMRRDSASTAFFRGQIDEVSVYSHALSASEIQGIFNAGSAGKCKNAQLAELGEANVFLGLKNSDDVGTKFDLLAEVFKNGSPIGSGELNGVPGGGSGFSNAVSRAIDLVLSAPTDIHAGDTLNLKLSVRIALGVSGHRSGTARLWFNDTAANSRFSALIDGVASDYFLLDGFNIGATPGPGPKKTLDVFVDRLIGGNPFKPFGTWSKTF